LLAPALFLIWFGLGALLNGLAVALLPLGLTAQLLFWSVAATLMLGAWLRFFRNPDRTRAGLAAGGAIGMVGLLPGDLLKSLEGLLGGRK